MRTTCFSAILVVAAVTSSSAQSCPAGTTAYQVTNIETRNSYSDCCRLPVTYSGDVYCSVVALRVNGREASQIGCTFSAGQGTYTIAAGTEVRGLSLNLVGGTGGDVTTSSGKKVLGAQPRCVFSTSSYLHTADLTFLSLPEGTIFRLLAFLPVYWLSRSLSQPGCAAFRSFLPTPICETSTDVYCEPRQVNAGDNSAISSPYGAGGGGYTAFGDAACAAANPGSVFPTANGVDCHYFVAGGGGGASAVNTGGIDSGNGVQGNSKNLVRPGTQTTSAGALPYLNGAGVLTGGAPCLSRSQHDLF
jgi:hypothetical protein